jgi:hypothetical protein
VTIRSGAVTSQGVHRFAIYTCLSIFRAYTIIYNKIMQAHKQKPYKIMITKMFAIFDKVKPDNRNHKRPKLGGSQAYD